MKENIYKYKLTLKIVFITKNVMNFETNFMFKQFCNLHRFYINIIYLY
jgi:hypothetical protein